MNQQEQITKKLLRRIKGSYYAAYSKSHDHVVSRAHGLLKTKLSTDKLIELLLDQKFMQLRITVTSTNTTWDLTNESFLEFVHNHTEFNFSQDSLRSYIDRHNEDGEQSPFLIESTPLSEQQKLTIAKWLKS